MKLKTLLLFVLICMMSISNAQISIVDSSGQTLVLDQPLTRIVSLAPHVTELLYAAGATLQIVGTVNYSDYPHSAKNIPRVGSYVKVDYEKLLALKPQLVIYWKKGNPPELIQGIRSLNIKLFNNEPKNFEDVAVSIQVLGAMLGTEAEADKQAKQYLARLKKLTKKYYNPDHEKISVFYQVWNRPLMTINKQHLVNEVIEFCGGINVFAGLASMAPTVDMESVLKINPQVIVAGVSQGNEEWLHEWQRWGTIDAVKNKHVYAIEADIIVRQTPRVLDGTEKMCEIIKQVRNQLR